MSNKELMDLIVDITVDTTTLHLLTFQTPIFSA